MTKNILTIMLSTLMMLLLVGMLIVAVESVEGSIGFREDFSEPVLDLSWQVIETVPGLGRYSLTDNPGYLRYYFEGWLGYSGGWRYDYQIGSWRPTLTLIRPFDGENWTLRTKVNYNLRAHIGGSSTGAQGQNLWIAFGEGINDYLSIFRNVDWWYRANSLSIGFVSNGVGVAGLEVTPSPIGDDGWVRETYWYEITRIGEEITVRFSNDGLNYTTAFSALLTEPVTTTQRAIIDMNLWNGVGSYADWDYIYVEPGNEPPDVSGAYPSVGCLWPPNHKFIDVTIEGVTDPDGDPVTITITKITSDEPTASIAGAGGAKHAPDAYGVETSVASLRAERSGKGNGRVYEITFVASDGKGGETEGSVTVCVPHDEHDACYCIDDGQNYDATQIN